jgi:hypothetical protein
MRTRGGTPGYARWNLEPRLVREVLLGGEIPTKERDVYRTTTDREPRRQLDAAELAEVDGGVSGATGLHNKDGYLPTEIRAPIYKQMAENNPRGFAQVFRGDPAAKGAYQSADIKTSYGGAIPRGDKESIWRESQDRTYDGLRYGWERTRTDRH